MNELISLIIPVYNGEKYIKKFYDCIKKQTYSNLEIIFVNDGSTDNSLCELEKIRRIDRRVIVVSQKNKGPGAARNCGIKISSGSYVSFLDIDDLILDNYIKELYANIGSSDFSLCAFYRNDINGKVFSIGKKSVIVSGKKATKYIFKSKTHNLCVVPWAKLFRAEYIKKFNFKEGIKAEDEELLYKVFYEAKKISCVHDPLYIYVKNENSESSSFDEMRALDVFFIYLNRMNYFHKKNLSYFLKSSSLFFNLYTSLLIYFKNNKEKLSIIKREFKKTKFSLFILFLRFPIRTTKDFIKLFF